MKKKEMPQEDEIAAIEKYMLLAVKEVKRRIEFETI